LIHKYWRSTEPRCPLISNTDKLGRQHSETLIARLRYADPLRAAGVPFRVIAARLGMSLGSVQKSVRRSAAMRAKLSARDAG
jgi:hypothetical protein